MDTADMLSVIEEEPDDWRSSRPSALYRDSSQLGVNPTGLSAHRISIFSSETSYGELLPPGQSSLGLGIGHGLQTYEKSLPPVPSRSPSQRSAGSSVQAKVKSKSSKHSLSKSELSAIHESEVIPEEEEAEIQDTVHSPGKDYSPKTIPSDQDSVSSRSTRRHAEPTKSITSEKFRRSDPLSSKEPRSPTTPRPLSPVPSSPSIIKKSRSMSEKSNNSTTKSSMSLRLRATDVSSATSRTESPIEFAPTTLSPHSKLRKSLSNHNNSLITSSSLTRSTEKPRPPLSDVESRSSTSINRSAASVQATLRTLDDVRDEVATSLALRAKMHAETITVGDSERVKVGVCQTITHSEDQVFMEVLADKIHHTMTLHSSYLFALFPNNIGIRGTSVLVFCGSPQRLVTKASIFAGLRFKTRLAELHDLEGTWIGCLDPHPGNEMFSPLVHDDDVLWDIIRKAVISTNPTEPPVGSKGIQQRLFEAHAKLDRLSPGSAYKEAIEDGILVDIRSESQRLRYGVIPGAMSIDRNELEWRFDPRSDERLPVADRYDLRIIVFCQDGISSPLAAASLQELGLWRATDIEGGYAKWYNERYPTSLVHDEYKEEIMTEIKDEDY